MCVVCGTHRSELVGTGMYICLHLGRGLTRIRDSGATSCSDYSLGNELRVIKQSQLSLMVSLQFK